MHAEEWDSVSVWSGVYERQRLVRRLYEFLARAGLLQPVGRDYSSVFLPRAQESDTLKRGVGQGV